MSPNDVLITGIGLLSSLGEGVAAHRAALADPQPPALDQETFAPFTIHRLPEIDWNLQIPKRGDQRQMETWQRLGTYVAGLALDDAGIKGDEQLCSTMDMIVAAAGGERDVAVDTAILAASGERADRDLLLNERLTTELRPTLFLAQLSNLLAGNISIVHKVTGSSRTFMGEEGSGVAAIETAAARIRSGQSTHALVGGAHSAAQPDFLLPLELGGDLHRRSFAPVWERQGSEGGGVILGSGGAFLVLESRAHAEARGAKAYAMLEKVVSDRLNRRAGGFDTALAEMAETVMGDDTHLVVSGASGAHLATRAEAEAFARRPGVVLRGFASLTGTMKEAQFPFAVALAALALGAGEGYPPFLSTNETPFTGKPSSVLATAVGFHVFEGMARLAPAE